MRNLYGRSVVKIGIGTEAMKGLLTGLKDMDSLIKVTLRQAAKIEAES